MLWGIAVLDGAGREATAELDLREALVGVADRDDLAWIATPTGIALTIDDVVPPWPLPRPRRGRVS